MVACGSSMLMETHRLQYSPETERYSHYAQCWLERQFDAVVFINKTRAVTALPDDPPGDWEEHAEDPPETYPFGM